MLHKSFFINEYKICIINTFPALIYISVQHDQTTFTKILCDQDKIYNDHIIINNSQTLYQTLERASNKEHGMYVGFINNGSMDLTILVNVHLEHISDTIEIQMVPIRSIMNHKINYRSDAYYIPNKKAYFSVAQRVILHEPKKYKVKLSIQLISNPIDNMAQYYINKKIIWNNTCDICEKTINASEFHIDELRVHENVTHLYLDSCLFENLDFLECPNLKKIKLCNMTNLKNINKLNVFPKLKYVKIIGKCPLFTK